MRAHRLLPRLFIDAPLAENRNAPLDKAQVHYLTHVLRLEAGTPLLAFNNRDGEWLGALAREGRHDAVLRVESQVRPPQQPNDVRLCLAPIKPARFDYAIQKATELGAGSFQAVITRRTQIGRLRPERMRATAIEAAEQCGALAVPDILAAIRFSDWLAGRVANRLLVYCDEEAPVANPLAKLAAIAGRPLDLFVGPEGGLAPEERRELAAVPDSLAISLGPRILRAETAALAGLVLIQAAASKW